MELILIGQVDVPAGWMDKGREQIEGPDNRAKPASAKRCRCRPQAPGGWRWAIHPPSGRKD